MSPMQQLNETAEQKRLDEAREQRVPWRKWGPYLSERQWGTVREDYSDNGDAWSYFSRDQAHSRAYHWGEDGLAGFCDEKQQLCFALALWNGRDSILKERLFGLTNSEGNHGEDVKEYYYYLDATPTHSYMKWLYKYPQAPYPYTDLLETNRQRSRNEVEYELIDTGVFDEDRYFDVLRGVRKGNSRGNPDSNLGFQSRSGTGPTSCAAHPVVPEYLDLVAGRAKAGAPSVFGSARDAHHCRLPRRVGRSLVIHRRRSTAAVYRERDQQPAHLRNPKCKSLCQRRHQQFPDP